MTRIRKFWRAIDSAFRAGMDQFRRVRRLQRLDHLDAPF